MITQQEIISLSFELRILLLAIITIAIFLIQWMIQIFISVLSQRKEIISLDAVNGIKFLVRFTAAISVLFFAMSFFITSLESVFGISALLGVIISFGSAQWVSNFVSGIYIIITRPFGVNDFIALGRDVQGEVIEISINYTKIKTIDGIYHLIPNRIFLKENIRCYNQKITRQIGTTEASLLFNDFNVRDIYSLARRLIEEKVVRYSFRWSVPIGNLANAKLRIQKVCDIYAGVFGYKPEFFLSSMGYKMQFTFIITTHNSDVLIKNVREFRNELVAQFH